MKKAEKEIKHLRGELYKANKGQQILYQENKELINMVDEVLDDRDYFMNKLKQAESRISKLEKAAKLANEALDTYVQDGYIMEGTIAHKKLKQALKTK